MDQYVIWTDTSYRTDTSHGVFVHMTYLSNMTYRSFSDMTYWSFLAYRSDFFNKKENNAEREIHHTTFLVTPLPRVWNARHFSRAQRARAKIYPCSREQGSGSTKKDWLGSQKSESAKLKPLASAKSTSAYIGYARELGERERLLSCSARIWLPSGSRAKF